MSYSPRRHGKAVLGATGLALLAAAGVASAAPPQLYSASGSPSNPRTTTPTKFYAYGYDPEETKVQFQWNFGGGYGALADSGNAENTFAADGVHKISARAQDAAGEATEKHLLWATHPDNWGPSARFYSEDFQNLVTEHEHAPFGQRLRVYSVSDDSPPAGYSTQWDLNNDGTFNGTGDGEAIENEFDERRAHFTTDGTHPVKVKILDGQGLEKVLTGSVKTHTANEAPYAYDYSDERTETLADVQAGDAWLSMNWSDDYTGFSGMSVDSWSITSGGVEVPQDTTKASLYGLPLPTTLGLGEHTVKVTISDGGYLPGEYGASPSGTPLKTTKTYKVTVIEAHSYPAELSAWSYLELEHTDTPTFRTLENISLNAYEGSGKDATSYAWDLDNDGQFDDSTGYSTYFSVANKGTYKVAAQMQIKDGAPMTVERTIVVDKGPDYAPVKKDDGGGGGGGTTNPPAQTPEQLKAAMAAFLSNETAEFLQLVSGLNKKGVDAAKAVLVLGTLGPDTLPNGGTGKFEVFDKAPKLARAAAAKKPKLLGTTTVTVAKGESKKVTVKLNKKGKALLKKKGKVKLTVKATLTDALTGAQATQVKSYTFKVKKKKKRK